MSCYATLHEDINMKSFLLTDADFLVVIVGVAWRALADAVVILHVVLSVPSRRGCGIGAERLAVIPAQVVDAHLHSVNARVKALGALVHI